MYLWVGKSLGGKAEVETLVEHSGRESGLRLGIKESPGDSDLGVIRLLVRGYRS